MQSTLCLNQQKCHEFFDFKLKNVLSNQPSRWFSVKLISVTLFTGMHVLPVPPAWGTRNVI